MTKTNKKMSLAQFLQTQHGLRAVASFVGERASDPGMMFRCRENAIHWMPCSVLREWQLADLIEASLYVDGAGVWRAKEVAL